MKLHAWILAGALALGLTGGVPAAQAAQGKRAHVPTPAKAADSKAKPKPAAPKPSATPAKSAVKPAAKVPEDSLGSAARRALLGGKAAVSKGASKPSAKSKAMEKPKRRS